MTRRARIPYTAIPVAVIDGAKSSAQLGAAVDLIRFAEKRRFASFRASDTWLAQRWKKSVGFARGVIALLTEAEALEVVDAGDRNTPRTIRVLPAVSKKSSDEEHDKKRNEEHVEKHDEEHANQGCKPDNDDSNSQQKAREIARRRAREIANSSEDLSEVISEEGVTPLPPIHDDEGLSVLDLKPGLVASLTRGGVSTVGELCALTSRQLLVERHRGAPRFSRIGPSAISEIEGALARRGRALSSAKRGRPEREGTREAGAAFSAAWRFVTRSPKYPQGKPYPWPKHDAGIRQHKRACAMLAEAYGLTGAAGDVALEELRAAADAYLNEEGGVDGSGPWNVWPTTDPPGLLKFVGSGGRNIERWRRAAISPPKNRFHSGAYLSEGANKYSGSRTVDPDDSRYGNAKPAF